MTDTEDRILNLVNRLKDTMKYITDVGVRLLTRIDVVFNLLDAYEIIDQIRGLEQEFDAAEIQHEANWTNWKFRKVKAREFMCWLRKHDVNTGNIGIELNEDKNGYRLITKKSFKSNKNLFRIPSDLIFSREVQTSRDEEVKLNDYAKNGFLERNASEDRVVQDLITEKSMGKKSFFKPYFDVLPPTKTYNHPFGFGKEEIKQIQNFDNLLWESALLITRFITDYCYFYLEQNRTVDPEMRKDLPKSVTFRKYLWARLTVHIYSTTIFRMDDRGILLSLKTCLVPLLEMCEFEWQASPTWNLAYAQGDLDDYVCSTSQRVPSGEIIKRQYSDPRTLHCFNDYGFVPYHQNCDMETYRFSLYLDLAKDYSYQFGRRLDIVKTLGFDEVALFDIKVMDVSTWGVRTPKAMQRLFLFANLVRGNTELLDLIERDDTDLTFLTQPTRMTWYHLVVEFRRAEDHFLDQLFNLYLNLEKEKPKLTNGLVVSTRDKIICAYLMNEFICLHSIRKAVCNQIEKLGPDDLSISDKYDWNEVTLRQEYEEAITDIPKVEVTHDKKFISIRTGSLTLTVVPPR